MDDARATCALIGVPYAIEYGNRVGSVWSTNS